jgi:hypothetical protein
VGHDSPLTALLLFPLILLIATAAGAQLLRWCRVVAATSLEEIVFAAATGLGTLSYALLAIGLLGAFHRPAFLILLGTFAVIGALRWLPAKAKLAKGTEDGATGRGGRADGRPPGATGRQSDATGSVDVPSVLQVTTATRLLTAGATLVVAMLGMMTLLGALAPPSSNDWDGLAYHLAAPKVYLRHGHIHFIEYDSHTNFPFTMEMLYGLGLSFAGAPLAKLFHWGAGMLSAAAIWAFVGRTRPSWAAPAAAALFLAVPQVAWEATTAYIDLGTTLYQFLALYAFLNALTRPREQSGPWWLVSGAMSGWAMGTKMTALLPFGLLVLAGVVWALRSRERAAWQSVAVMGIVGGLVASPWYVKSYLWTNNPVYPFFYRVFPKSIHWTPDQEEKYKEEQHSFGLGRGLDAFLRAPWNTAMEGAAFFTVWSNNARLRPTPRDRMARYLGDVWGSIGVTLLGFVPLCLFGRSPDRRAAWLLAYLGASGLLWFALSHQTRYLLPVLAPASALASLVVVAVPPGFLRVASGCFLAIVLLVGVHVTRSMVLAPVLPVVLGQESRESYVARTMPDLYPALRFVNTLPGSSRVAFFEEVRGYYADRDYFWANPGQHNIIPYERLADGRALARFLREKLDITHVLVNRNIARQSAGFLWYERVDDAIRQGAFVPLYEARGMGVYAVQ